VNGIILPVECGFVNNQYCVSIAEQDTRTIDRICDPNSGLVHGEPPVMQGTACPIAHICMASPPAESNRRHSVVYTPELVQAFSMADLVPAAVSARLIP
jgi:hypothetical protein